MLKYLAAAALAAAGTTLCAPNASARPVQAGAEAFAPTRFTVEVEGTGPDVILIPGLASPRQVWDGARSALGGRYRLHLVQLNGFGGTPAGANGEGGILPATVAELSRYIAANKIRRPAIVGHSMGGFFGLTLAKEHPDQVGRLMIVDSLPFIGALFDPSATAESIAPRAAAMRDMLKARAGAPPPTPQEAAAAAVGMSRKSEGRAKIGGWTRLADQKAVGQAMYEVMTSDLRPDLAAIRTEILMLYPWDEATVDEARARAIYEGAYAAAPNARLVAVPHSQHFIMIDQPERFHALLAEFLAGGAGRE